MVLLIESVETLIETFRSKKERYNKALFLVCLETKYILSIADVFNNTGVYVVLLCLGSNRNTYLDDYVHFADFKTKIALMRRLDGHLPGSETNGQIGIDVSKKHEKKKRFYDPIKKNLSFFRLFHQVKKAAHGEFGVDITSKVVEAARYNLMIKLNLGGLRIGD